MIKKYVNKYKQIPKTVKASIWYFIASFMHKGIAAITTPIFTRILNTEEYGQFQVFQSWHGIFTLIFSFCIYYDVCAQGLVKYSDRRESFLSSLQGLTITLVGIWSLIYFIFRNYINSLIGFSTAQMVCMIISIWATAAYQFWAAEQRVTYNYLSLAILTISISLIKPICEILFILTHTDKLTARIVAVTISELLCYSGLFVSQMKRGKVFYSGPNWKHAIVMGMPLIPHYLSQRILQDSDRIMIERMIDADKAGIYSLAYSVSVLMTLVTTAITQTITPWLYSKIKEKDYRSISRIVYPILVIVAMSNIVLIGFAPELVSVFAPPEYHEAIWVIPPIAMSVYFIFSYGAFSVFEFYYEKTGYVTIATGIGAILNILLNYIFIKLFGYYAAGYTTLFCYMAYTVAHYFFMRKICREFMNGEMVYSLRTLCIITAVFLGVGFIFLFTYTNMFIRYALIALIVIVILVKRNWLKNIIHQLIKIKKKDNNE